MKIQTGILRGLMLALVIWGVFAAGTASAQRDDPAIASAMPPGEQGKTLRVGIKVAPPFVIDNGDGTYSGLSIELWQAVAARLGLKTQYRAMNLDGLFQGLEDGQLDIAVAALTTTAERESKIDFTFPFYSTGLAIAAPATAGAPFWSTFERFLSWPFFTALAALAGLLLIVGAVVWMFERRGNPEEFGGGTVRGLGAGFWWAAVTMTTVGYGDKSPRTLGGRFVGLIWMFAAIIIISSFTAAIATSLTVDQLSSGIHGVNDLKTARVATVADSAAAASLQQRGIAFATTGDLQSALDELAAGRVDAVVYDAPLLKYLIHKNYPTRLSVLDSTFERQDYAFALPQGSNLREPINRAILEYLNGNQWDRMVTRYVGSP